MYWCKTLHTKVIWDAEFNGMCHVWSICRLSRIGLAKVWFRARLLKGALLWPNGQIDIPAVLPMQKVVYKGNFGCWIQWKCLFGELASLCVGMAKARLGHVPWRAPYYDPMVKLTLQQFYRLKKLHTKVILDAEFNGSVCLASWRLCVWVWPRHVSGASPEGHPIMTQWSNWYCSSSTDSQSCIQRLFWMLSSMDVSVWWFFVYVAGSGQGTSPEGRPIMTQRSNEKKLKNFLKKFQIFFLIFSKMLTIRTNFKIFVGQMSWNWTLLMEICFWKDLSWRPPHFPMVKLTFQQFTTIATTCCIHGMLSSMEVPDCRFRVSMFDYGLCTSPECIHFATLWSKRSQVIWDAEFSGSGCLTTWHICGRVWHRHVSWMAPFYDPMGKWKKIENFFEKISIFF